MIMSLFRSRRALPSISYKTQGEAFRSAEAVWLRERLIGGKTYVFSKNVRVGAKSLGVRIPDEPDHVVYRPGGWVLVGWSLGLWGLRWCTVPYEEAKKTLLSLSLVEFYYLSFPGFLTRPVAFWERVWAGGRLSAHAEGGRAVGELLRGAKAVRLRRVGRAYGAESRIAGIHGVAFALRLVQVVVLRQRCFS